MARPQTQASYEARLNRVVDYIYEHLEEDIRPALLAEIACLSSYHWLRVYVAMRGETIGATIRRLRLMQAADRLANSEMPVRTIAERAGYGAADAFARAFKEAYGKAPADYRATGSHAAFRAASQAQDAEGFPVRPRDSSRRPLRERRARGLLYEDRPGDGAALRGACSAEDHDAGSENARRVPR